MRVNVWLSTTASQRAGHFPLYVLVSDVDFNTMTLAEAKAASNKWEKFTNAAQLSEFKPVGGCTGRYVRVQLEGHANLQIAELEVFGGPGASPTVTAVDTATRDQKDTHPRVAVGNEALRRSA